mgnify:CR=1 FL=1
MDRALGAVRARADRAGRERGLARKRAGIGHFQHALGGTDELVAGGQRDGCIEAQQRGRYNADLSRAVEELRRDNRLNIGRAVRGRVTNEWVVPLRLGIYDGKGTLTHVIAAALPLTRPISFWEGVPFPNSGGVAINLVREDVYLIGRYPLPQGATAEEVYGAPRTGEFAQRLAQGKLLASGVYQGTAALTGESVLWGYGRLQRYPLAFVIQAPSTLLWNRWWGQVWPVYGMLAFILLCAILIYRVAVNREISNHRESEIAARKLKESETRLELAVRGSRDGIWDWNVVTGENYFSPRWLEILGYAAHELPHTAAVFFDRLHPDDKDAVVDAVKRVSGMDFPVHYAPRRQGDPPEIVATGGKIKSVLGFKPRYDDLDIIVKHALAFEQKLQTRK